MQEGVKISEMFYQEVCERTGFRCMTELLDITVWSFSRSRSLLSSAASGMLFTELL